MRKPCIAIATETTFHFAFARRQCLPACHNDASPYATKYAVIYAHRRASDGFKEGGGGRPPVGSYFFQKAAFFRVKGVYFVVRICDK